MATRKTTAEKLKELQAKLDREQKAVEYRKAIQAAKAGLAKLKGK